MRHRARPITVTGLAACVAVAGACSDAPTAPNAAWVAVETEAALRIEHALPTLPNLIERVRSTGDDGSAGPAAAFARPEPGERVLERAASLWRSVESAPADDPGARRTRLRAYRMAAEPLAAAMDPDTLARMRAELEAWVEAAGELDAPSRFPEAEAGLANARAWLIRARDGTRAGDREDELVAVLQAADYVSSLTPEAVAKRLIAGAEAAVDTASDHGRTVASRTLRRAERMVAGAREALAEDDPVRAIRRAYYATRLLDPR